MGYSGEHFDAKLQQQYLRARWYNPANGRFDPFVGRRLGDERWKRDGVEWDCRRTFATHICLMPWKMMVWLGGILIPSGHPRPKTLLSPQNTEEERTSIN
jgi:hypothetical protein